MGFQPMIEVSVDTDREVQNELHRQEYSGNGNGEEVRQLVRDGWANAQTYAADSFVTASNALDGLANAADLLANISGIDPNLADISVALTNLTDLLARMPNSPAVSIAFTDQEYASSELTLLQTYIDQWIQGRATGLPPDVEQAIWERGRSRELATASAKAQEAMRSFASRGFSKPPGALSVELQNAAQEAQDAAITLSRDVMVKQADLEQSNRRFAFDTATKIQTALMAYMTDKMRRALDVAKSLAELTVAVFGHQMQGFSAQAGFAGAYVGAQASVGRILADVQIAEANLRMEASRANLQALIQKATVLIESIRATAQISGQLSASALAAVNLSGGVHDTSGWNVSISEARSRSVSASLGAQSSRQENYTP